MTDIKITNLLYVELIACYGGSYDCAVHEEDGVKTPNLHNTREEGQAELDEIVADYDAQIVRGEREEGNNTHDIEIFPCTFDGKSLTVLDDELNVFLVIDCSAIEC